jgi:hypothetical protein
VLSSFPEGKNNLPFLFTNTGIMFGDSYTERKIDFVTGHTGSNIWDITQVTLVAPVCRIPHLQPPITGTTSMAVSN